MTEQTEAVSDRPRPCFREGPPADDTCQMTRVVRRGRRRLEVWTCTAPRPTSRVKFSAYPFAGEDARRWWPGCSSAWYDAFYSPGAPPGRGECFPGRTQFVVYDGERGRKEPRARRPAPVHYLQHRLAFGGGDPGVPRETGLIVGSGRGVITLYFPRSGEIRRYQVDSATRLRTGLSSGRVRRGDVSAVAELCAKYGALRIQYVPRSVELDLATRKRESAHSLQPSPVFNVRRVDG